MELKLTFDIWVKYNPISVGYISHHYTIDESEIEEMVRLKMKDEISDAKDGRCEVNAKLSEVKLG